MIIKRGFKSVIDREAKVYENPPSTLKEELSQIERRVRIGAIFTNARYLSLFFNPKYGIYALLILPFRNLFPYLFPFFSLYIMAYLIFKIKFYFVYLFLIGIILLLVTNNLYSLIQLAGISLAWLNVLWGGIGGGGGGWKKVKLSG